MTEPTDATPLNVTDLMRVVMDADNETRGSALRGTTNWAAHIGKAVQNAVLAKWGAPPAVAGEPVAYRHMHDDGWEYYDAPTGSDCPGCKPLYTTPQPIQAQAGVAPLDEARRLFDAGWKAAALFCDREDVVADGIIGFGACPQFEAAFAAAHGIKGGQHGDG